MRPSLINLCRQLLRHDTHPAIQFIKYGIAGGIATLVHIVTFYLCALYLLPALAPTDPVILKLGLHRVAMSNDLRAWHAIWNNVIAFVFSNLTAYLINVFFVFKPGRYNRLVEIAMFYAVSAISVGLGSVLMGLLITRYQLSTTLAFGAVTACSLLINFAMRKFVIFKG